MTDHPPSSSHGFTEGSDEPGGIVTSRAYWMGRAKTAEVEIERLRVELAKAKEEERERCAKIADQYDLSLQSSTSADYRARAIAAAIRGGDAR